MWNFTEFAQLCLIDEWKNHNIIKLSLDNLEEEIIDLIHNNNYLINVFPVGNNTGFVVELDEFINDLKIELDKY